MDYEIRPLRSAGFFLGVGLAAFLYGILFSQLFQFHGMVSNRIFPDTLDREQINVFWDGLLNTFAWIMMVAGLARFWNVARHRPSTLQKNIFIGAMVYGAGVFCLVEGFLFHQVLGLHRLIQYTTLGIQAFWDIVYLAFGVGMTIIGLRQIKKGQISLINARKMMELDEAERLAG